MSGRVIFRHAAPFGWVGDAAVADGAKVGEVKRVLDRWHWYTCGLSARRTAGTRRSVDDARRMVAEAYHAFLRREMEDRDTTVPMAQLAKFQSEGDDFARLHAVDVMMHDAANAHGVAVRRVLALASWRLGTCNCLDLRWKVAREMSLTEVAKTVDEMVAEITRMDGRPPVSASGSGR